LRAGKGMLKIAPERGVGSGTAMIVIVILVVLKPF
jgi:hypothetical protein